MPFNVLQAISQEERLKFAENFSVERPTVLDEIFPDEKTEYWKAEYFRLMNGAKLPDVAFVHALDTEAEIGQRVGFEKVELEKLFIKRKINQTENIQMAIEHGVPDDDSLINYVYDDASNLFEGVLARTKIMKAQVLCRGELKIKENNVNMTINYGLDPHNKIPFVDWTDPDADIMGDIQKAVAQGEEQGYVLNTLLTSRKLINAMRTNKAIITAVVGIQARQLTKQELANFIMQEYGLTIKSCDEKFRYKRANGTFATGRYFDENKVSFYEANANGSLGVGLFGPTPEEGEYRAFVEEHNKAYITLSMWATPDPVATWTKASALFIPVMPKINSLVIGTVAE